MVTVTLLCPYCESDDLVCNGHAPNGKQRYFCKECKRYSRENPARRGYSEERKEEILRAYQAIIPEEQHTAVGKETGETAHVERWNNTLRQRLGRFVRKTLSFSKSTLMHIACLDLFLHRYNLERAISL